MAVINPDHEAVIAAFHRAAARAGTGGDGRHARVVAFLESDVRRDLEARAAVAPQPPAEAQAQGGGESRHDVEDLLGQVALLAERINYSAGHDEAVTLSAELRQLVKKALSIRNGLPLLRTAPPSAPVGEFVQHPNGDGTIVRKSDPLLPLTVDEILAAMNRPSAPVGVNDLFTLLRRCEGTVRRLGWKGDDYELGHESRMLAKSYEDGAFGQARETLRALAQQPAAVDGGDHG